MKALIQRRRGTAAAAEGLETALAGMNVESVSPAGALVELQDKAQVAALEAQGYRVKTLPDPASQRIGIEGLAPDGLEAASAVSVDVPEALAGSWLHHLVELTAPPTEPWIRAIEELGIEVVEPIATYSLFAYGHAERAAALRELEFVREVRPFGPAHRISPNLIGTTGLIRYVSIGVYPPQAVDEVAAELKKMGASIREIVHAYGEQRRYSSIIAELETELVPAVARLPLVRWLELVSPEAVPDGERETQIVAENLNGNAPVPGYAAWLNQVGLDGQGVTVAICDTGVSQNANNNAVGHLDLRGRQAAFVDYTNNISKTDTHGHGTHVAGIVIGNGASGKLEGSPPNHFRKGQGMAPGASYVVLNAIAQGAPWPPSDWNVLTGDSAGNGAAVMNNSWRDPGPSGGYTAVARRFDQLIRDPNGDGVAERPLVIVFSAGNDGPLAGTITPPKEGKNTIVVGNSLTFRPGVGDVDDIRGIAHSSSRGPARDGRILPIVVAPGTDVLSARAGTVDDHVFKTGTSMAAPHVTGACALLIERLRGTLGADPSPALLKALLVNGAEDLAGGPDGRGGILNHVPDNDQGWGRVSLRNILLDAPDSDRGPKLMYDQAHPLTVTGQEITLTVAAVDATRPLRITLAWTDAPGAANASPALVNDLDLEVVEVDTGRIFKGNVFVAGFSDTEGSFDPLNNVECVYVAAPRGAYEINVVAGVLRADARPPFGNAGWQDFALVVDNASEVQAPQVL